MLKNYDCEGFSKKVIPVEELENGKKFKVSVRIPMCLGWIERVKFSVATFNGKSAFQLDFANKDEKFAYFEGEVFLENSALYHYYFSFEASGKFMYYKKQNITGDTSLSKIECWKMSVGFETPEWAKGAIMYHIFVDRYCKGKNTELEQMPNRTIHENWDDKPVLGPDENGNWNIDFFGGNLKGIEETISYIKSLGVTIIYLSPIVRSQSNHRYDTADYENVDPYAGTNEDLKKLCKIAHQKGMKVILDGVFNHTGNDSKYFNQYGNYDVLGAFQSDQSPYYPFYKRSWNNGKKGFAYWWGMQNLPECDGNSKEWKEYILGVGGIIDQWFKLGIDGLRLDVADELTDEFIEGIRIAVHRNKKDGFIIGEVWKNPMRMNRGYISSGKGMDSVMNYQLVDALIRYYKYCDINKLKNTVSEILIEYPDDTIHTLMNFTSTHDISRIIEICGCNCFQQYGEWSWNLLNDNIDWVKNHEMTKEEYSYGKNILKSYVTALAFLPGIFSIFYGDEVGVKGIGNLMNRGTYPWGKTDKTLLEFFRSICRIKEEYEFLKKAETKVLSVDENIFMYERYNEDNSLLVITSRTHHEKNLILPSIFNDYKLLWHLPNCKNNYLTSYGAIILKK